MLANQSLTSVVLPKPAGAAISVSLPLSPALKRSNRRGRATRSARAGGAYSLVASRCGGRLCEAVERGAKVIALACLGLPSVQRQAHAQWAGGLPLLALQRVLSGQRGRQR